MAMIYPEDHPSGAMLAILKGSSKRDHPAVVRSRPTAVTDVSN
jgi:hypothetical protein